MAMTTNLPPQAYTRETLVKAIDWLSRQPSVVKERANSADLVVSHYLQACRRSDLQMDAPVSGEVFREDLKHLAQDLKQFEEPFVPPPQFEQNVRREPPVAPVARLFERAPERDRPAAPEPIFRPEPIPRPEPAVPPPQVNQDSPVHHAPPPTPQPTAPRAFAWQPDARSLALAREIQHRLNLGSEAEGLRLLITLGAESARALFP